MVIKLTEPVLERLGVPKVHWSARMSEIPAKCRHRATLSRYVTKIKDHVRAPLGLLLFGPYSSGKSAAAAICLKAAAADGVIGFWTPAFNVPKWQIEKTIFDSELTVYDRCLTVPLLVIDEYQMRKDMKYTEDAVDTLVRSRIDDELCTIITTNHSPSSISVARPAMFAALQESLIPVKFEGHDFRRELASQNKDRI
jgi:DNA replication protein DnaC